MTYNDMVSPAEWGSRVNYDRWTDRQYEKDLIAVHWGGTHAHGAFDGISAEQKILRGWEDYHLDVKGWRGIAYGYGVGASGTVFRLRGSNNYGAHTGDYDLDGVDNNREIIPVVFILGEGQSPTTAMWAAFSNLRTHLSEQDWSEDNLDVSGHRVVAPKNKTQCPGDEIMKYIQDTDWLWKPDPVKMPEQWIKDMKDRYDFTMDHATEVAQYQGGSDIAFAMGVTGSPMDGWNLLLIMELAGRIE